MLKILLTLSFLWYIKSTYTNIGLTLNEYLDAVQLQECQIWCLPTTNDLWQKVCQGFMYL